MGGVCDRSALKTQLLLLLYHIYAGENTINEVPLLYMFERFILSTPASDLGKNRIPVVARACLHLMTVHQAEPLRCLTKP